MEPESWEDEIAQASTNTAQKLDVDDLFEFTESLTLDSGCISEDLEPVPDGYRDLSGDRGVLMKVNEKGEGTQKPSSDYRFVELNYDGFIVKNGEKFDTSRDQGYAFIAHLDIPVTGKSSLIRGLELGLREVAKGDKVTFLLKSDYGYGKEGMKEVGPNEDLRFEVEVLDIRETHKVIVKEDNTEKDLSRLEQVRLERERAQARREEQEQLKEAERKRKAERAELLKQKLAAKRQGGGSKKGGGGGKKKKK